MRRKEKARLHSPHSSWRVLFEMRERRPVPWISKTEGDQLETDRSTKVRQKSPRGIMLRNCTPHAYSSTYHRPLDQSKKPALRRHEVWPPWSPEGPRRRRALHEGLARLAATHRRPPPQTRGMHQAEHSFQAYCTSPKRRRTKKQCQTSLRRRACVAFKAGARRAS